MPLSGEERAEGMFIEDFWGNNGQKSRWAVICAICRDVLGKESRGHRPMAIFCRKGFPVELLYVIVKS